MVKKIVPMISRGFRICRIGQVFVRGTYAVYKSDIKWLAKKLAVSISIIRKLAVVFIPVEIQKFY